jgi:hypothetical protein
VIRVYCAVVALRIVVDARCDDGLDSAVRINLHVIVPTAVIGLARWRDGAVGEYFSELRYDRRVLIEYIRVHQSAVRFVALAVLDVSMAHTGAGITGMCLGPDEVDAIDAVVAIFEIAADIANVNVG